MLGKMKKIYLAKWRSRFFAWLIDILIVGAIFSVFSNYSGIALNFGAQGLLLFFYWTFLEGFRGQSIGKMALNIKVTDRKSDKISFTAAAIESFGKAFILPLDCLIGWIAMPDSRLRLFNRLSNTIVIEAEYMEPKRVKYVKGKE
jgi:uncharacterized RDD family membrane protein YckC